MKAKQGSDVNSNKTVFAHILNPSFPLLGKAFVLRCILKL